LSKASLAFAAYGSLQGQAQVGDVRESQT